MRVALLQYPIAWGDKETNLREAEQRIQALSGKADIALLPEMFTTGFCTEQPELAEDIHGGTITALQRIADATGVAVAGSFICRLTAEEKRAWGGEKTQAELVNRGFFVRPNDTPIFTDKAHLYAHGGEDRFFRKGKKPVTIEYKGVKIRMIVCYDLRFPVWSRNTTGYDYDLLLVCANWPAIRIQYWDALIAARATENQCYIAAVNPVGDDGAGLHYNGHSIAYDTRLAPLASFAEGEQGTRIADFDMERLKHFREVLPLWKDADKFVLSDTE